MNTNKAFHTLINEEYPNFQCNKVQHRRFKHADLIELLKKYDSHPDFQIETLCYSVEQREIKLLKYGTGSTHILLWSQMHGNEASATQSLLDIFNFLSKENAFEETKRIWREKFTLHFVPMLNPDGAQKFKRRNAFDIDPNRDALVLQSPETKALMEYRANVKAQLAFNLHDQEIYYSAGIEPNPATIAFLSPAFDNSRKIDEKREDAMKLIAAMDNVLQHYIPQQVARYSDAFEPRAFGDRMQELGTTTILIESGGDYDDPEKQVARKMNTISILAALEIYAQNLHQNFTVDQYLAIPENKKDRFFDLIIRNVYLEKNNHKVLVDIGIRREEVDNYDFSDFVYKSFIHSIGDLSGFFAYQDFDGEMATLVPAKKYPYLLENIDEFKQMDHVKLWKENYLTYRFEELPVLEKEPSFPANFIGAEQVFKNKISLNENPSFFAKKNGQNIFAVVNGFLFFEEDVLPSSSIFEYDNRTQKTINL